MSDEMQTDAIDCAAQALEKYNIENNHNLKLLKTKETNKKTNSSTEQTQQTKLSQEEPKSLPNRDQQESSSNQNTGQMQQSEHGGSSPQDRNLVQSEGNATRSRRTARRQRDYNGNQQQGNGETEVGVGGGGGLTAMGDSYTSDRIRAVYRDIRQQGITVRSYRDLANWLVPHGRGQYCIYFTIVYTLAVIGTFAFMAGQFEWYSVQIEAENAYKDGIDGNMTDLVSTSKSGPADLAAWVNFSHSWRIFDFDYLLIWGGRYGPKIYQGQHYRWITSLILHLDFRHVLANMLLVVFLIAHLEHNYGTWRVLVVWILSSMGGNFLSAAFEDGCTMVVGASSAVFGFVGLFIADVVLNFESIGRPVLRIVGIGVFFVFFVITLVAESGDAYVSHFSHVGGLLCGLFPSVMFLPNVQDNRWRAARGFFRSVFSRVQSRIGSHREAQATLRRIDDSKSCWSKFPVNPLKIVGGAVLVFMFVFLPIYVYTVKLPSLKCEVEGEIDLSTVRILIS
eukprot:TRINITY_DN6854_c0_g2_i6.p1 TRINITY_DN6854_c0_g2~~TRINITY_DN6854_c0_g2_i6.p1  ORF type:complete len:508 (-),score=54.13 TRINITY_DN6854_c0_g2_i6:174-1697(-)